MRENEPPAASPNALIDAVLKSAAEGRITLESGIRLIFMIRRAGEKGYTWWKRTRSRALAGASDHDHQGLRAVDRARFTKLRPNPFKGSAKIVTFPWSKVWDDSVWDDTEKVASMLPDLREAFGQKSRQGHMHATKKGGTDATFSMATPLYENLESEGVKKAAAGTQVEPSMAKLPENHLPTLAQRRSLLHARRLLLPSFVTRPLLRGFRRCFRFWPSSI